MGRQHQGMDRPGVRQVPEGSGEQRKLEETGREVICGAPTTPAVTGKVKVVVKPVRNELQVLTMAHRSHEASQKRAAGLYHGTQKSNCEVT